MRSYIFAIALASAAGIGLIAPATAVTAPEILLEQVSDYPYVKQVAFSEQQVVDHEIGLGAIQKTREEWRFKDSERLTGTLVSYTWQVESGSTSAAVMDQVLESIAEAEDDAMLLFKCEGRACGKGVQWANRVFGERVLYGREDLQQYRVYALQGEKSYRLVGYSAARTADRQYFHVELIRIDD
ncbi:MAG: DUF4892 domain-containing protein [Halioglobus sp.]|nr:DUF4892 domain-containing protein [Halioglobus sp.]